MNFQTFYRQCKIAKKKNATTILPNISSSKLVFDKH